jgi:hypothetical protein
MPCQVLPNIFNSRPYNRVVCTGATSVTDFKVRFPVESYTSAPASNQNVTFQIVWYNNTGGSVTPQLSTKYPSAQDNWTSSTTDLSATNLQSCAAATACIEAYTLAASNSAFNGYEFVVDFGNNFASSGSNMSILAFDARVTPGVSTGLNSNPPPIELRDRTSDVAWNQSFFQSTYDNGVTPGTATHVGIIGTTGATGSNNGEFGNSFRTAMRCDPTVSVWDGAGNINKVSFWNNTAWTDNNANAGTGVIPSSVGQNGFVFYYNTNGNLSFHYTADCTIPGG